MSKQIETYVLLVLCFFYSLCVCLKWSSVDDDEFVFGGKEKKELVERVGS